MRLNEDVKLYSPSSCWCCLSLPVPVWAAGPQVPSSSHQPAEKHYKDDKGFPNMSYLKEK